MLLVFRPRSVGIAAEPAQRDVERVEVEQLDAAVGAVEQRVVLVAQPEVDGELLVHLPAVGDVEAELVLAAGHLLELHALAVAADLAEQERRVRVPAADAGIAGNAGDAAGEGQRAARVADLGLPVRQFEPDEVEAGADLVAAGHLGQVDRRGVAALVAHHRRPRGVVAEDAEAGLEHRHAAVTLGDGGAVAGEPLLRSSPGMPNTSVP